MDNNYQSQLKAIVSKGQNTKVSSGQIQSQPIIYQDIQTKSNSQNLAVFLRAVTWMRDSHGLFDYESKSINKKSMKTNSQGKIVRIGNDIELVELSKNEQELGADSQTLLQIKSNKSNYYLDHSPNCSLDEEDGTDRLWLVIRSLKSPEGKYDYKIKKFDVIKLGRVKFRIKDFACEHMGQTPEELFQQELKEAQPVRTLDLNQPEAQSCRFCWGNESTEENPCIVPCHCTGSVGFIHYDCLKNWLSQKMSKKESNELTSMYWRTFECEICKYAYPYLFKVDKKVYKLVDIQQPKSGHFMVMESLPLEKNTSRTIHVLNFSNEKLTFNMGRGHESEVRVNDISVSRCHAIIKYKPEGIFIEDNRSKFGTLVLLKESYNIMQEYTSAVQIGRTVVSFTVRNTAIEKQSSNVEGGIVGAGHLSQIPLGKVTGEVLNGGNCKYKESQKVGAANSQKPIENNSSKNDDQMEID